MAALPDMPEWTKSLPGTRLIVDEWEDVNNFRTTNGWQGRDLIHDKESAVRVFDYYVDYPSNNERKGGVGTKLRGVCYFSPRSESHAGYCHGGSMTSTLDDVVGWCGFVTTGRCLPWSGFTVQVNTSLFQPIIVGSVLMVQAEITNLERRKVSILASIMDPANGDAVHASCDGLVVLNRGVLPEDQQSK